ncbi:hypothetical protein [Trinickia fusca]|uniref:Uncharacterized protein n=1 Tax=Trinickia fusca TaxID=2419777 RepID=A0A494XPG1_9BURK|nr:hypothetical protein [Trinickia fusca]RKP49413.1 hypothetical protein D7S89_11665 [Trinickia fusca]
MNVAFPAAFVFLLIIPGFLFRQLCQRRDVRTFDHRPLSTAALQALYWAAVINFAVTAAVGLAGYRIAVGDIVRLLAGGSTALAELSDHLAWLNDNPLAAPGYFALTNVTAFIAALAWRGLIEWQELDRRGSFPLWHWVRGDAPWYYLFSGLDHRNPQGIDAAIVAAIVEFKEGAYLYTGVLLDYEVSDNGKLDRLLLGEAQRRKLERDRRYIRAVGTYVEDSSRFYPIAGDVFVLRYDEIKTLNVTYLSLAADA